MTARRTEEERVRPRFAPSTEPARGRVRVGFASPVLYQCGAETWQHTLARSLDPSEVCLRGAVVLNGERSTDPAMLSRHLAMMPVGYGHEDASRLARSVDLLIGWDLGDIPIRLAAMPDVRAKVAIVSHSPPESDWGRWAMSLLDGVDAIVAVSELAMETIPTHHRGKAEVIRNAVDPDRLKVRRSRELVRSNWGVGPDTRVVLYYGRTSGEKGYHVLPSLARELPEGWAVVVVGGGPGVEGLRWQAREIPGRLIVPGQDPAAGDVLNAADVLLNPSDFESYGLSLVEGLWVGLPVVSTPVGMAKVIPDLVHPIPIRPSAREVAGAVVEAQRLGPKPGSRAWARSDASPERFGREWTSFVLRQVERRSAKLARVATCPDRGTVLPISLQEECGCKGKERSECRRGLGTIPGRVTLDDCLECAGRAM